MQGRGSKCRRISPLKAASEEREDGELCEEEEEGEGGEGEVKKMKLTNKDETQDEFTPFSYSDVNFTDYTGGGGKPSNYSILISVPSLCSSSRPATSGSVSASHRDSWREEGRRWWWATISSHHEVWGEISHTQ